MFAGNEAFRKRAVAIWIDLGGFAQGMAPRERGVWLEGRKGQKGQCEPWQGRWFDTVHA